MKQLKIKINKSENDLHYIHHSDNFLIFFPGSSGAAESDRFSFLNEIAKNANYSLVKYNYLFLKNEDDYVLQDAIDEIDQVVDYVKLDLGAKKIVIVAKSIGAFFAECSLVNADKFIFLGPLLRQNDEGYKHLLECKLSDISAKNLFVKTSQIKNISTLVICGDKDVFISKYPSFFSVKIIPDETHSLENKGTRELLIKYITEFLD